VDEHPMNEDKFTNIFRLPHSFQIRIGKWQQTLRGTSDLILYQALQVRNEQFRRHRMSPSGWHISLFNANEISVTHHGKYIQTTMRTMIDRKVGYQRIYLSTLPLDKAEPSIIAFKKEWIQKHNRVAKKYNQIKLKEFMKYAQEEVDTLYPSLPKGEFDRALWNKIVISELGSAKKFNNPFFVKKAAIL
jgi:hypothetical protein